MKIFLSIMILIWLFFLILLLSSPDSGTEQKPCLTVHWKNGEVTNVPYREMLPAGCGLGSCSAVEFYNNDNDKMIVSKDSYYYYEPCKDV